MTLDVIQLLDSKLKRRGILMITWGWVIALHYGIEYALNIMVLSFQVRDFLNLFAYTLIPIALIITVVYALRKPDRTRSAEGKLITYVWVGMFMSMVLVNLILANVQHTINFELQHPIFMVIIGASISITGKILGDRLTMIGGVFFAALAYLASFYVLTEQLLIESIGWLVAFVLPGHLLYSRKV